MAPLCTLHMIIRTDSCQSLRKKKRSPHLSGDKTLEESKEITANLNLPYRKFIDYAVPDKRQCGVYPIDLAENLNRYCQQMTESPQG